MVRSDFQKTKSIVVYDFPTFGTVTPNWVNMRTTMNAETFLFLFKW